MNLYRRLNAYLEAHTDNAGPLRGTASAPRLGMIWLAANLVVTTLLTGTLFVPGVAMGTALAMIVVGTLIGAVVLTLVGNIGTRTGLPTMALTRASFGTRGTYVPVAANVLILMGWSWVQAMLAGVTVNALVEQTTGFSNPVLFSVICEVIVVLLAIFGHEGISKVEPWLAVAMIIVIGTIFYTAFTAFSAADYASIAPAPELGMAPAIVLDIVVATAISWTVLSADINRMARSSRANFLGAGIGYSASTIVSMSLGAIALGYVMLQGDEAPAFDPSILVTAFGAPFAVVVFLSVMATNTMAVYGMVTSAVNARAGSRLKFLPTALVLGGISVVGSTWMALLDQFTSFLVVIGSLFVPVFAVMLVDYYILRRRSYAEDILNASGGRYWYRGGFNAVALVVWALGAAASLAFTYLWPLPVGATLPTFALTFLLYLGLSWSRREHGHPGGQRHLAEAVGSGAANADTADPAPAG
ncbi:cytosine permease [Zhihengliuella sp.]|uniref:purine-cytosine permease family protein n=1 Tax=Zhihengliuella sp. TaxID=1954483 RepID=UPI00281154A2|nr:cytosine permease [Zhihengliuella sp.]